MNFAQNWFREFDFCPVEKKYGDLFSIFFLKFMFVPTYNKTNLTKFLDNIDYIIPPKMNILLATSRFASGNISSLRG